MPNDAQLFLFLLTILVLGLAIGLAIFIFYLLTLQNALKRVSPRNRLMEPGMVWLLLVPCLNLIWQFIIAIRVPDSLRNEFRDRQRDDGSDYGKSIALTAAILGVVGSVFSNMVDGTDAAGCVSLILLAAHFVLFLTFWVKVAGYSRLLALDEGRPRDLERILEQFDDDDRPLPRGDAPKPGPSDTPPDAYREDDHGRYH